MWPSLGFVCHAEQPARRAGEILNYWWYDGGQPDLFRSRKEVQPPTSLRAVIDTNILYDLRGEPERDIEESSVLQEDWLRQDIELCITPEVFNDIALTQDSHLRAARRNAAIQYPKLTALPDAVDGVLQRLRSLIEVRSIEEADLRHLAHAAAANELIFVTRDRALLAASEKLFEESGISVVRPCDVVSFLDDFAADGEYGPARLGQSRFVVERIRDSADANKSGIESFVSKKERPANLRRRLYEFISRPHDREVFRIGSGDRDTLVLGAVNLEVANVLTVELLRFGPFGSNKGTVARAVLDHIVRRAVADGRTAIVFADTIEDSVLEGALLDRHFLALDGRWVRLSVTGVLSTSEAQTALSRLGSEASDAEAAVKRFQEALLHAEATQDAVAYARLERALWPVKIHDAPIPNFIVPIRPTWASQICDIRMASENLFGVAPELALNVECAYYRSCKPIRIGSPARVLWYVSSGQEGHLTKRIRSCSQVTDAMEGLPKEVFRKYRRLGVYNWGDVFELARNRLEARIAAFSFSETEMFTHPIRWRDLQDTLTKQSGKKSPLVSPLRITKECFWSLYEMGTVGRNRAKR
jgi:hypothetical protein